MTKEEALNIWLPIISMGIKNMPELKEAFDMAVESLKDKWTPISERPPEENMACLVSVGNFNLTQIAMYSNLMETIDHRIFYQGDYGHDSFNDITEYVKAWMPLPERYKPKEEGIKHG